MIRLSISRSSLDSTTKLDVDLVRVVVMNVPSQMSIHKKP
jgi:hypothetical protein